MVIFTAIPVVCAFVCFAPPMLDPRDSLLNRSILFLTLLAVSWLAYSVVCLAQVAFSSISKKFSR